MANQGIAFVGNKLVSLQKASLPVTDFAIQRGVGTFEVMRTYQRRPLALAEHLKRLQNSTKLIGLKLPHPLKFVGKKILQGLSKVKYPEVLIKIFITGGDGRALLVAGKPRLLISFQPYRPYPSRNFHKGVKVLTCEFTRFLPEAKHLDYLWAVITYRQALKKHYHEVLYLDPKKNILEGTTFNLAIIKGKKLITPKEGILAGITMEIILKLAKKLGLKIIRRPIRYRELKTAREALLTSTIREVTPVVQVDKIKIGNGRPGEYTRMLLEAYREYVKR